MERPRPRPPGRSAGTAIEFLEDFVLLPGRETRAVIGHGKNEHGIVARRAHFDRLIGLRVSGGVGEQSAQRLLHERRVHRNRRQIFGDADSDRILLQSGERDRLAQEFARIAPFAHRLEKSRFQTRGIEQMIDRAGETSHGLLQLRAIGLRLLQRRGHGGEWRFQFVRDGIEKRLLKFLRLAGDLCGAALFQRALFVHEKRELRGKSVEQFALLDRRRSTRAGR